MFPYPMPGPGLFTPAATAANADPVVFITSQDEAQPVTSACLAIREAQAAASATMRVRVNRPYRVIHNGEVFLGGDALTVPDDVEHSRWVAAGWVTKVKGE